MKFIHSWVFGLEDLESLDVRRVFWQEFELVTLIWLTASFWKGKILPNVQRVIVNWLASIFYLSVLILLNPEIDILV